MSGVHVFVVWTVGIAKADAQEVWLGDASTLIFVVGGVEAAADRLAVRRWWNDVAS